MPARPPVDLVLAMPRPKVMRRLWGPLASIGVDRIFVIGAERTEACYFSSRTLGGEEIEAKLIEGLEQVRDTWLPEVVVEKSFRRFATGWLPNLEPHAHRLLGHPGAEQTLREVMGRFPKDFAPTSRTAGPPSLPAPQDQSKTLEAPDRPRGRILLAVGPEGGWTDKELDALSFHGFIPVRMRDRALRTDTAVVSLLALVYDGLTR